MPWYMEGLLLSFFVVFLAPRFSSFNRHSATNCKKEKKEGRQGETGRSRNFIHLLTATPWKKISQQQHNALRPRSVRVEKKEGAGMAINKKGTGIPRAKGTYGPHICLS